MVGTPNFSTSLAYSSCATWTRHVSATSASAACVRSISSLPRMSRTPIRRCSAFLKSCKIGSVSVAPRHNSSSVASSSAQVRQLVELQRIDELVDHAGIGRQDIRQIGAGGAQTRTYRVQRWRIEPKQIPQHAFAAERIADPARLSSVRRGRAWRRPRKEAAAISCQQMPAAARGKKGTCSDGQIVQRLQGHLQAVESKGRQCRPNLFLAATREPKATRPRGRPANLLQRRREQRTQAFATSRPDAVATSATKRSRHRSTL